MSIASNESQIEYIKKYLGNGTNLTRCLIYFLASLEQGKAHTFKASSFASSSQCDFCLTSVWGLSRSTGYVCEGFYLYLYLSF